MNTNKILLLLITPLLLLNIIKAESFSLDEISKHNNINDCWVLFENKVYDITNYIPQHDKYLDIQSWCGNDISSDFKTKDDRGRDHKVSSYSLLENYLIGEINNIEYKEESNTLNQKEVDIIDNVNDKQSKNPYIFLPIFISMLLIYWIWYVLINKVKNKIFTLPFFNFFWNSLLVISFIPTVLFGIIMIMQYSLPSLRDINFDFLFWHVEGSIIASAILISHFITRIRQYIVQLKYSVK